jgi:hypothetical protein
MTHMVLSISMYTNPTLIVAFELPHAIEGMPECPFISPNISSPFAYKD